MRLLTFAMRLVKTLIFVEILDPPIIHVTGSFLFLIIRLIDITFLNNGLAYFFYVLCNVVHGCLFSMRRHH